MKVRVFALGQPAAGDDGVGLAVLEALRAGGLGPDAELAMVLDPADLVPALGEPGPVVLVDAVVGPAPGTVLVLAPSDVAGWRSCSVSSHGIAMGTALALARSLSGGGEAADLTIVGIGIARPVVGRQGLSPAVAAAVPVAAASVRRLVAESQACMGSRPGHRAG
jgi:hydrogenase maturation protease